MRKIAILSAGVGALLAFMLPNFARVTGFKTTRGRGESGEGFVKSIALTALMGGLLSFSLHASPAQALPRTYLSATGLDSNDCSLFHPCATFNQAYSQTDNGGTISCLSSGFFGPNLVVGQNLIIAKSLTLDCTGHTAEFISLVVAGANIVVVFRGMTVYGLYGGATTGVLFTQGNALHIENCKITANAPIAGVRVSPASTTLKLYVTDTEIAQNNF